MKTKSLKGNSRGLRARWENAAGNRRGRAVAFHNVVTLDFSACSLEAVTITRRLAAALGARVTVLHIVEPFHADLHMDTTDLQRERRRQAREQLQVTEASEWRPGLNATAELRAGHPLEVITRFARESGAGLIVLSAPGRRGLPRALIGSVAERVVRHAPCPALVVPASKG